MKQSPRKATAKQSGLTWFYVSFSGESVFLGAAFVWARTKPAAIRKARFLGTYPGAVVDVLCLPISRADMRRHVPISMRSRRLNESEVRKLGGRRPGE